MGVWRYMQETKSIKQRNKDILYDLVYLVGFLIIVAGFMLAIMHGYNNFIRTTPMVENTQVTFTIKVDDRIDTTNQPISGEQYKELTRILEGIEKESAKIGNNYLSVDTLNSSYAIIFTLISVLIALAGLVGWKKYRDFDNKIKQLNDVQEDVNTLKEKSDLAKKVQEKFYSPDSSMSIEEMFQTQEEIKEKSRILALVSEDYCRNGWLEVIYAKNTLSNEADFHRYRKAYQIYEYILKRDFIDKDKGFKSLLYHLLGQLLWQYYNFKTDEELNRECPDRNEYICMNHPIDCTASWMSQCDHNGFDEIETLKKAIFYYERSLQIKKSSSTEIVADETLGNLAIVQIKLALEKGDKEKEQLLKVAENNLKSINNKTYNHYWDLARVYYYLDNGNTRRTEENLIKAVERINSIKITEQKKKVFIDGLADFYYPGENKMIIGIKERLWSK